MKSIRNSFARAGALALLLLGGFIGAAQATGTAAGTDITNSATLTYKVGTVTQGDICSSPTGNNTSSCTNTTFKVDNLVNLSVTTSAALNVVPGALTQTLTFTVSNTGNGPQDYVLSLAQRSNPDAVTIGGTGYTDTFDTTSCSIKDSTGAALAGDRLVNVLKDTSRNVLVVCNIPATKSGGAALTNVDASLVTLSAVTYIANNGLIQNATPAGTVNDPTAVETIFADGAGSDDALRNGEFSARGAYQVQTSDLKVTKTVTTLCDPLGGQFINGTYNAKSVPGAYMRYTVTIANQNTTGAVSANLTQLVDALDSKVTFDGDYITGTNNGATVRCQPVLPATTTSGVATNSPNVALVTLAGGVRTSFTAGNKYLPSTIYNSTTKTITVDWTTVLPGTDAGYAAGELKKGETLTLTFNVSIN